MASDVLDERKRRILKAVTDDYIRSAEPVGSRALARKYNLGLSPATIRNEMADLEEEGYLQQPHTSAGRIPSDMGYRYYVDALMEQRRLRPDEMVAVKRELAAREWAVSTVIHQAARALAQFTHYPSLILSPNGRTAFFKHVRLIKLSEHNLLVLVVTDTGQVENKIVDCPPGLGDVELETISNLLNKRLRDHPLSDARISLERETQTQMQVREEIFHRAMEALVNSIQADLGKRVITDGATQILDQPEFAERDQFRPLLNLLEREESLYRLLTQSGVSRGLKVSIGQENKEQAARDCSVVTATYEICGRSVGVIGVLGPTRMDYASVLAVVEFMATHLSSIFNDLAGR